MIIEEREKKTTEKHIIIRLYFLFISSDVYDNGSLFIRPFRDYSKSLHAGTFICHAENAAGSIQTTPIQLKPRECLMGKNDLREILYLDEISFVLLTSKDVL